MARIRAIKPDFFRHEKLYETERATGLPLRIAFAGLWTVADREGRFRWTPRALKLDCLPYDDVDFSLVMDALKDAGFIVEYTVQGERYGFIPAWSKHQVVNTREAQSSLPDPALAEASVDHGASNVTTGADTCVHVQEQGEGKGKEQEGKGSLSAVAKATRPADRFEDFWKAYPRRKGDNPRKPAEEKFARLVKSGIDPQTMIDAAKRMAVERSDQVGTPYIPQAMTWLSQQRWIDHAAQVMDKKFADDGLVEVLDDEALTAWDNYRRAKEGRTFPRNARGGWRFPSKYPPGYEPRKAEASPPVIPQLPRMSATS